MSYRNTVQVGYTYDSRVVKDIRSCMQKITAMEIPKDESYFSADPFTTFYFKQYGGAEFLLIGWLPDFIQRGIDNKYCYAILICLDESNSTIFIRRDAYGRFRYIETDDTNGCDITFDKEEKAIAYLNSERC